MTKYAFGVLTCLLVTLVSSAGCSAGADDDDGDLVAECQAYLAAERNCLSAVGPEVAQQRAKATRSAFKIAAKDPAGRNKLAAQCRAAQAQISRTCR
ncbi:hypothetical protein LZC95_16090 [Pendulispora brunnea]|uniref:Secreted protein n=1 Tax=Pendulispora brunnea TaxID=2905690 RepID=A0ABZ2KJV5_9BACT